MEVSLEGGNRCFLVTNGGRLLQQGWPVGHHREGILHDWARRGVRPRVDDQIWWLQAGNDLKVGYGAEEAGTEKEERGGWGKPK